MKSADGPQTTCTVTSRICWILGDMPRLLISPNAGCALLDNFTLSHLSQFGSSQLLHLVRPRFIVGLTLRRIPSIGVTGLDHHTGYQPPSPSLMPPRPSYCITHPSYCIIHAVYCSWCNYIYDSWCKQIYDTWC